MANRPSDFADLAPVTYPSGGPSRLPLDRLRDHLEGWVLDAEIACRSPRTVQERQLLRDKLLWFLQHRGLSACGPQELRAFLAYLGQEPSPDAPRWGNKANAKNLRPVSPATVKAYHRNLSCFFRWLVREGEAPVSPMERIPRPRVQADQVQPFTSQQVQALLAAAGRSHHPRRNQAILWFLLDTGARRSELCQLRVADVDFHNRRCHVEGKGRKRRMLPLGRTATRALWAYHNERPLPEGVPAEEQRFFVADQGHLSGIAFTEDGVFQLIQRLGETAGIQGVRCSPHTLRHTFAVEFLRAGGNVFALQEMLGHTTLSMVRRYLALAEADVANQHRQYSPADRLRLR